MIKTVPAIPALILLLASGFPPYVHATTLSCSITVTNPYCAGGTATVAYSSSFVTFPAGNKFTVELSDAGGSFASPVVIGSLTTSSKNGSIPVTFPATASGTGYRVRVVASNPAFVGSNNGSNITINTITNTSVSITIDRPGAILCDTHTATFSAIPTPNVASTYAWRRNGSLVGTNSSSYVAGDFVDGDAVNVTMTSSASCPLPAAAVSNTIVITQKATVTPAVTIDGPSVICSGNNTTFTATPFDGGTSPSYQWKRNGNAVGANSATFTTNTLITGDIVIAEMTSNRACIAQPTVSSNNLNIKVTSVVTPTITISADPSTPVGPGSVIYLSPAVTGGGSSPTFEWKKNGAVITSSSSLVITDPQDGEKIMATITSSANCAQPSTVDSNTITLSVNDGATQSNHAWTPRTGQRDVGGAIVRVNGSGFTIGTKAYVGLGYDGSPAAANLRKDFWEYDPATDTWTQKATFPGAARYNAVGFSVAGKGYIGTGTTSSGAVKDFYQYDPINNTWKLRASLPTTASVREQAFGLVIAAKGYIGGGYVTGTGDLNDFYEYDPLGNAWKTRATFGGGKRLGAASFTVDTQGFVAGGYSTTSNTWFKDLWEYDPASDTWTQRADMPGEGRSCAAGFALGGKGYVGLGNTSAGYAPQFFQYDVSTDTWSLKQYYPGPQSKNAAMGMTIGNRAFVYKDGVWIEFSFFTMSSFSSKICTSETIPVSFDASGYSFPPNTTFTVQISTQQNFSVGTNLGTLTSNTSSGVVVANFLPTVSPGDYYLRIVTNNAPPLLTPLESITVTSLPPQSITAVGGLSVCNGTSVIFTSDLTGTGFQWYKNNNRVGDDSPTYEDPGLQDGDVITAAKTYTVGCSQPTSVPSNLLTMKVRTPPKPLVTVTQPNKLTTTTATAYQWYQNGNAINKATSQFYVMTESGVYKVKITDNSGCEAFSDDVKNAFTGLLDEEFAGQINTYPNPVAGEMVLEVADDLVIKGVDYSVLNELGQCVFEPQKASKLNNINFTGKPSGLYMVRVSIDGSTAVRRVVKVD
jgi:N-acetylneuraminic acid mutarotase